MLEFEGIRIGLSPDVYAPEEDTLLLLDALKKERFEKGETALEVGCGTGLLSLFLARRVAHVTGTDINEKAVELSRRNALENDIRNATFFASDMFDGIEGTFDAILFNPPYLPAAEPPREAVDLSYHGGADGRVLTSLFLRSFKDYLNKEGRAYLLQSSLSGIGDTLDFLSHRGWRARILAQKNLLFEKLIVVRVSP